MIMDCARARELLATSEHRKGQLEREARAALGGHLVGCAECRRVADVEAALDEALDRRLPRHRPTPDFARRLRARLGPPAAEPAFGTPPAARPPGPWRAFMAPFGSALAAAALVVLALRFTAPASVGGSWDLVDEVVSDHLRVVASTRAPEIESGGIHQVKPWFTGRVDFAPRLSFEGDADTPLVGGSLGYVRDRKAAILQFRRRLHAITLLIFPAEGMPWPNAGTARLAERPVVERTARGFTALLWRDGELGYALVSDVNRAELAALVPKITPAR
jgi:anti-sigma factor RsiW